MRLRKRYFWPVFLTAAVLLGWKFGYQSALKYFFRVSGTVTVSEGLLPGLPGANSMLFIVARNEGGVPVAVRKVINPVFPYEFELTSSSLIMPDLLTRRLYLEAALNTHGRLEDPKKGDLKGARSENSYFISKGQDIVLDGRQD
ncbi:MAG: hypothetical protein M0011_01005 [Elusimicrobia bacterium]|nr:hypothetical protein [Elusimicrobiota bacterium]